MICFVIEKQANNYRPAQREALSRLPFSLKNIFLLCRGKLQPLLQYFLLQELTTSFVDSGSINFFGRRPQGFVATTQHCPLAMKAAMGNL
jgi:hypothetical protein